MVPDKKTVIRSNKHEVANGDDQEYFVGKGDDRIEYEIGGSIIIDVHRKHKENDVGKSLENTVTEGYESRYTRDNVLGKPV